MWAEYDDSGIPGRIVRTYAILGDLLPPARVLYSDSSTYNTLVIRWNRPTDQVDYYNGDSINGSILGYDISIMAEDKSQILFNDSVSLKIGRMAAPGRLLKNSRWNLDSLPFMPNKTVSSAAFEIHCAIQDGLGFQGDSLDEFELTISGLNSEVKLTVAITAMDFSGNSGMTSEQRTLNTTDSIAPILPVSFWFQTDTLDSNRVRVDSNRVVLFWLRSVDPLKTNSGISYTQTNLVIPKGCLEGTCYRNIAKYQMEWLNGSVWVPLQRGDGLENTYLQVESAKRWTKASTGKVAMVEDSAGQYTGDTLRWMIPGDTVMVRLRSIDSSGAMSSPWLVDTLILSRGNFAKYTCPSGFVPAKGKLDSTLCVERFEHRDSLGKFSRNVLFSEARATCKAIPGANADLCSESQWASVCASGGSSYGTIQESDFRAETFLMWYCNQGTGDSASALNLDARNVLCSSRDGVRDLPGQLQEWTWTTLSRMDTTYAKDSSRIFTPRPDTAVGVLKGSSYVLFDAVVDRSLLAKCTAKGTPVRNRPKYTLTKTAYLYFANGRTDTLLVRDTTRVAIDSIKPNRYMDSLIIFKVARTTVPNVILGYDTLNYQEYLRRGESIWTSAMGQGILTYSKVNVIPAFLYGGTESRTSTASFYFDGSIGFRCCAQPKSSQSIP
jgi:hypothetical protein